MNVETAVAPSKSEPASHRALLGYAYRIVAACLALSVVALLFGDEYVRSMLPLYRWTIARVAPDFLISGPELVTVSGEKVIWLTAEPEHSVVVAGRVVPPHAGSVSASTLAGRALQHPIILFGFLLAWPGVTVAARVAQLLMAVPALMIIEMVDVPLVLWGAVMDLLISGLAPGQSTLLVSWMHCLDGGGRIALCIAAALAIVSSTRSMQRFSRERPVVSVEPLAPNQTIGRR